MKRYTNSPAPGLTIFRVAPQDRILGVARRSLDAFRHFLFGPDLIWFRMPDIDESQLIDASLQGNSSAFGQLVQVHQHRLFNAMAHFCGNAVEAEDVVQDAFVQAYQNLAKFQRNSQFYTWLYRIAVNTAISRRRRKRVEASVDKTREQNGLEPIDAGDAPGDQMMRDEQAAQVQRALATLSDEHRSILVLREMDGCDYEQIAEILEINVGTVRSRLHRARMQLRERLLSLGEPL